MSKFGVTLPHPTHHLIWVSEGRYYKCPRCGAEETDGTWHNLTTPCVKGNLGQITFPISQEDFEAFERECEEGERLSFQNKSIKSTTRWHNVES